jgi:signal recognition particle receptor subunit beta
MAREVTVKLVYYGPALSGKTTNLRALHNLTNEESRGRLMTLDTKDDRTLFFDMLPLVFRGGEEKDKGSERTPSASVPASGGAPSSSGKVSTGSMSLRIKVFTVPGQVLHAATRKLVLQGADGVAFIADSQLSEVENNATSFVDLRGNLKDLGLSVKTLPLVIQFNKRDMPKVRSDAEIESLASKGNEPVFKASAVKGDGVLETFFGLLHLTWSRLNSEHQLAKKLGLDSDKFLANVAQKLGYTGNVDDLLRACVGGSLKYKPPGGGAAAGGTGA